MFANRTQSHLAQTPHSSPDQLRVTKQKFHGWFWVLSCHCTDHSQLTQLPQLSCHYTDHSQLTHSLSEVHYCPAVCNETPSIALEIVCFALKINLIGFYAYWGYLYLITPIYQFLDPNWRCVVTAHSTGQSVLLLLFLQHQQTTFCTSTTW
jgi:hypothetical protein